jgi:hypothetical protein
LYQWEEGGYKERVKEGENSGNIMHLHMKMEKLDQLKVLQDWGEGG